MPTNELERTLVRRFRDRQALLWVCQAYDLVPGAEPHSLSRTIAEVEPLYRPEITDADRKLIDLYWEAMWLEGANSPILRAIRAHVEHAGGAIRRPVTLAGPEDATASFSDFQFLPVCVLPGLLDTATAPENRFGAQRERVRQRVADDLAARLARYPRRVLVVVGAKTSDDLRKYLYPAIEDNRVVDLDLLIVAPPGEQLPPPDNPAVRIHLWRRTAEELADALAASGAPRATEAVGWSVRVKDLKKEKTIGVRLNPEVVQRAFRQFVLITEDDIRQPGSFTFDDLTGFLNGDIQQWAGYAIGLAIPREYRTQTGRSLPDSLLAELQSLADLDPTSSVVNADKPTGDHARRTRTLTLPCVGGSGATTLLRMSAFAAAAEGYPTLLLRTGITDLDLETLTGFATTLTEEALNQGIAGMPPFVLVLDADAMDLPAARRLAGVMAYRGRPAVILRAVLAESLTPPPLTGETQPTEVEQCERVFREVIARWRLPIESVPTLADWKAYEKKTQWTTPTGATLPRSLFWVALRFFLTNQVRASAAELVQDALGSWITKRDQQVTDEGMRKVLLWVAALSAQRIVCPLGTALRPVTSGGFSSSQVRALQQMSDLVEWSDYSDDFGDHTIQFIHPAFGEEYLRMRIGQADPPTAIREMAPLIQQLSPGSSGDRWLAERLVTQVLTPGYEERKATNWNWRLAAFEMIPTTLSMDSRPILHHWARCLYQSAADPQLTDEERQRRFEAAIRYLRIALRLPRRQVREEHPSHLYNTLGVACSHLARLLEDRDPTAAQRAWNDAWDAFQQSISLLPGNIDALFAYSRRLLERAGVKTEGPTSTANPRIDEVARALSLLDEAEEVVVQSEAPDPKWWPDIQSYRAEALNWLSKERVAEHLAALKISDQPELGYYCEAQLVARGGDIEAALKILNQAKRLAPLGPRSLRLEVSLLRRHPTHRYEFARLLAAYEQLERAAGSPPHPVEQFRHAVLCFQVGRSREGDERFRRLRELERRGEIAPPTVREFWRSPANPDDPRPTQIRVTRWMSEWRADGYADELGLTIPLRPRHFSTMPKQNDVVDCYIRFEFNGPLAIPRRFLDAQPRGQR